jgi:hypothetical protein
LHLITLPACRPGDPFQVLPLGGLPAQVLPRALVMEVDVLPSVGRGARLPLTVRLRSMVAQPATLDVFDGARLTLWWWRDECFDVHRRLRDLRPW